MRAGIMPERNGAPVVRDVVEPQAQPGTSRIQVLAAGLQPTDILRARGLYKTSEVPYVIGGEGVGVVDGARVYFGHSIPSSGALSEWSIVPDEEVWPVPDDIDSSQAIALGIAGTGALIPLQEAHIRPGERVLILGATGPLGQIGLQVAKLLGAGAVVAAARGLPGLERLKARGIADEIAQLGLGNDESALKAAAGRGFDVVLDCIYGPPAEAAMKATADGGRMMSIGVGARSTVTLALQDLVRRSHHGVGTGHRPVDERRSAWEQLLRFALDEIDRAWAAQLGSPGGKIVVRVANEGAEKAHG